MSEDSKDCNHSTMIYLAYHVALNFPLMSFQKKTIFSCSDLPERQDLVLQTRLVKHFNIIYSDWIFCFRWSRNSNLFILHSVPWTGSKCRLATWPNWCIRWVKFKITLISINTKDVVKHKIANTGFLSDSRKLIWSMSQSLRASVLKALLSVKPSWIKTEGNRAPHSCGWSAERMFVA